MLKNKYYICVLMLAVDLLFSVSLVHALSNREKEAIFSEANSYFNSGNKLSSSDNKSARVNYQKALLRYKRLVDEGDIVNGKLYYNIGNTYFKLGDLGRAILNYRRAERLLPNDLNVMSNLNFAKTTRKDKVEEKMSQRILKTLLFWHYDLSLVSRRIVFLFSFAGFWFCLLIRLFRKKMLPSWVPICLAGLSLVFFCSVIVEQAEMVGKPEGVIVVEETFARKGDGLSYEKAFKEPLHSGTEFSVVEDRGDWVQIELLDGRAAWVSRQDIELI